MERPLSSKLRNFGRRLLQEESGQSIVEYVLVLFIVVLIAKQVKEKIMKQVETLVDKTGGKLGEFDE